MNSIRQTVAETIFRLAQNDPRVIALTADLSSSVGFDPIKNELSNQFVECGIAEQEMLSMAAGLSLSGYKPFAASYTEFHPGRNWDQLRTSVCYNKTPVRLISSHYGLSVGGDGATHQNLEYLSLTLCLPNLSVFLPFNNTSGLWCVNQMYQNNNTGSILFQPREKHTEEIEKVDISDLENDGFVFTKNSLQAYTTHLIITGGLIANEAFKIDADNETPVVDYIFLVALSDLNDLKLNEIIAKYDTITVVEEHQRHGGLGSIIFEIMAKNQIKKSIRHICVENEFGKSGLNVSEIWDKYGISKQKIASQIN
jgi:transketolase